jgi:hypothetical protein
VLARPATATTGHLEVRIDGRITPDAVAGFAEPVRAAVATGRPFTVLFDRSSIAGPTAEGRVALDAFFERWSEVAPLVAAWADVYDERRAASLLRAYAEREARGEGSGTPYPHRICRSVDEAGAWLTQHRG